MKKLRVRYSQPINSDTFEVSAPAQAPAGVLVDAILVTSEICGQTLSAAAARRPAADGGERRAGARAQAALRQAREAGSLARCSARINY
jgi:hypothetical protein